MIIIKSNKNLSTKLHYLVLALLYILFGCKSDDDNNGSVATTDYDISSVLSKFDDLDALSYSLSQDGSTVTFNTTNLPNHKSPYWNKENDLYEEYNGDNSSFNINKNIISTQTITITIPLNPMEATNKQATPLGPIGIAINGIVFFNQYAGPDNQPLTDEINSFDQWAGHPTEKGQYHYHLEPTYLTDKFGNDAFLGLLADGFPVYGPEENGSTITNSDLDEYHGHVGVTADFPDGIYHYHITPTEDPYINGNGYFGTPGNITQ